MVIYIALLRGINVGRHNRMSMTALKGVLEDSGLRSVQTYIQSGNVVFEADETEDKAALQLRMEQSIQAAFGFSIPVVLRTAEEFDRIIRSCPYPVDRLPEEEGVHISYLVETPTQEKIQAVRDCKNGEDEFHVSGHEVYLLIRKGLRDSKLAANLQKLGVAGTLRNWNTVTKLDGMAKALTS
ncbi:DUF1697 domain-containing protein [Paenibacillus lutrae]|uniref:DUF1697 domain-containing protein n=1 Tax=Paenibacillus lutrae TaxID=2078573 RepID=A0A7X3FLQ1_9BACL|nr:DUF1697 domain-containing protein [Paenibacillus lutrae]